MLARQDVFSSFRNSYSFLNRMSILRKIAHRVEQSGSKRWSSTLLDLLIMYPPPNVPLFFAKIMYPPRRPRQMYPYGCANNVPPPAEAPPNVPLSENGQNVPPAKFRDLQNDRKCTPRQCTPASKIPTCTPKMYPSDLKNTYLYP